MFGGNMGNMANMMKKVQKLQADMAKLQEELKTRTLESTAGGGAIKVVVNGEKQIQSIKIDPAAADPQDIEMLEDMIMAAVNEALKKVDDMMAQEMGKLTGGMKIPGMS
jgi:DNA-binding YbaB/EbfC family protein